MSNKGIRDLKRKKRRENKTKLRNNILKFGALLLVVGGLSLGFNNKEDEFRIKRPVENRSASASINSNSSDQAIDYKSNSQIATAIGFEDVNIDDSLKVDNDQYSNTLKYYVKAIKSQYCYQVPNDYSKTKTTIKSGDYIAYYGSENSFAKIKLGDTFYYVNRYGLSKLDDENNIRVVNGIIYVDEENLLPSDFNPGVDKTAKRAFDTMLQDMNRENLNIRISSDFRSYDLESKMYQAGKIDGEAPGTSEHQTGTAFDFYTSSNEYSESFKETEEYKWLQKNAYKYGFIERYPENKISETKHIAWPWHFRFVGVESAKEIYENDLSLEKYLKTK